MAIGTLCNKVCMSQICGLGTFYLSRLLATDDEASLCHNLQEAYNNEF